MSGRDGWGNGSYRGSGDGPDDGAGWHEPAHLGAGGGEPAPGPESFDRPTEAGPVQPSPAAHDWALRHGWTVSDGGGPGDAVLAGLVASAPVRPTRDHRAAGVLRGRFGSLDLVAFDVVYASGRYLVPQWAVTAAPLLVPVPTFRLSPARFWKHRVGGLLHLPSGDPEFDSRWMMLTAEDSPAVRAVVGDPTVRGLLLGTDDGDEFWSAAVRGDGGAGDFIAAIRPDGHRPELLEHHGRLLTAIVGALMSAGAA